MKKTFALLTMVAAFVCLFAFQSSASIVSEAKPITLDNPVNCTFNDDNYEVSYNFTPSKTDYYELTVENFIEDETYICIYDKDGEILCSVDDDDFSGECYCADKLTGGETYYYVITCYSFDKATKSTITLSTHSHEMKTEYIDAATTDYDGYYTQKCKRCGYEKDIKIPKAVISFPQKSFVYNGKTITPEFSVKDSNGKDLKKNTDYTITGTISAYDIGSYSINVNFKGNYTGTEKLTYKILPAKVTSLKASSQTSTSITLTWNKVSGAGGYIIYSYDSEWDEYTKLTTVSENTATISKLSSGKTYKFVIKAYKKVNNTNFYGSDSSILTTTTKPAAPKPKATQTSNSITISWGKVSGANGYIVYSYDAKTKKYSKLTTVTTNKATIKNLSSATSYSYSVQAYKKLGSTNYYSSHSSILNTATKPAKPSGLKATQTTTTITLTWNKVKGATSYTVYDLWRDKVATSKTNSVTIKKLYPSCDYTFVIVATAKINGKNYNSADSSKIYTATKPEKPSEFTIYAGKKSAELWWFNDDCTDYQIYMATSKNGKYSKVKTLNTKHVGSFNTTIKNLKSGKTYYFKVRGYVKNGNTVVYSSWSAIKSVKVK